MKNKRLILVGCCVATAVIASPALAAGHQKSGAAKPQRMAARTAHVGSNASHARREMTMPSFNPNRTARVAGAPQPTGTRYYGGNRYAGTRYYGNNGYYAGSPYYYGGGSSSVWPYVAASFAPYVASSLWAPGYNHYPYSYYGGYPYRSSYYGSGYGYDGSTVAAVQRRLGEMGYYHGVVDGVIGPRTRGAIIAFESRHGLVADGTISRPLLNRLGIG